MNSIHYGMVNTSGASPTGITQAQTQTDGQTHTHTHRPVRMQSHTHKHTHTNTHIQTHIYMYAHVHAHTHFLTHTRTCRHTHAHAHTHTHTHHIHTRNCNTPQASSWPGQDRPLTSLALVLFFGTSSLCFDPAVGISFWWPSGMLNNTHGLARPCLLYTSPSPRDGV